MVEKVLSIANCTRCFRVSVSRYSNMVATDSKVGCHRYLYPNGQAMRGKYALLLGMSRKFCTFAPRFRPVALGK